MNDNETWEIYFPKTNLTYDEKKRIYDDFYKNCKDKDFYKFLKNFKDINPNYDWKKYINVFLPHFLHKPGSFPNSLLPINENYPIPGTIYNIKPASILNEFEISVSNDESFLAKFGNIKKM